MSLNFRDKLAYVLFIFKIDFIEKVLIVLIYILELFNRNSYIL